MVMEISGSMEDPHPHYEQLRRLGSVPYDTAGGNYWVLATTTPFQRSPTAVSGKRH
jgi:hypothetical protein